MEKWKSKFEWVDFANCIVVVKEIESWYLAGIDEDKGMSLRIKYFENTNELTKEKFVELKPGNYRTLLSFKKELLKHFSIRTACKKNDSFGYFAKKYLGECDN